MNPTNDKPPRSKTFGHFAPTRWTCIISAQAKDPNCASRALEELCQQYWTPLYAFARRQGFSVHDAQDHTQGFFARLLQKDFLRSVAPEKGRFRTFLLVAFKRFIANARDYACAAKRGGGEAPLSLDVEAAENLYKAEPLDTGSADIVYERRWALTLLDRTMNRLREEYAEAGRVKNFEQLKIFLTTSKGDANYADVANALGMSAGATRVAACRLRRRYRELFRDEIAQTVSHPDEIEDEISHLLSAIGR
ncbi:MAG: sigma-70 family RNA polymerase sigma factor [Nibricoccus sp.]